MDDQIYKNWINYIFNHDETKGDWRFDPQFEYFQASDALVVKFITRILENYRNDIAHFSDWQIALGLDYIFNNSCSDYSLIIRDEKINLGQRLNAIIALKNIYSDYFNKRCNQSLGHLSEPGNELNRTCYMLWDTTPLSYCEDNPDKIDLYKAVAEVMEYAISLDNIACIESGLHGLGHISLYYPETKNIIKRFIDSHPQLDVRLKKYAEGAKSGCIL